VPLLTPRRSAVLLRAAAAALTWAALTGVVLIAVESVAVPANVQVALFAKIATFDRALPTLPKKEIAIGVLYERRVRASLESQEDFVRALSAIPGQRIADMPFHSVPIDWDGTEDIGALLDREPIQILYVTPLRAVPIEAIAAAAKSRGIRTWTAVPEYVERGLALGISLRGDRPLILVNLPQARAEGYDLSSQLLKLARVIP
jgi:uncharacterized protein DUF4154